MSSSLNITKALSTTGWTITATLTSSEIPTAIFVYENTGTTTLGTYQGVVASLDLPRIQVWTGAALAVFGNKYVRYTTATIHVTSDADPDDVITGLKDSVQFFSTTFKAIQNSSQVLTIT
jgi:hypothetical protein